MKNVLLSLGILLLTTSTFASSVDLTKSSVSWEAKKVISGGHNGLVAIKSADLVESHNSLTSGIVVIDLNNIEVKELEGEWKDKFLTHIKSSDFFDVAKYPTATLKIEKVKENQIIGFLTIKDKTNPIKINFIKKDKNYSGTVVFDRTLFNLTYGSNNFFKNLGDKAIANEVTINFTIVLK